MDLVYTPEQQDFRAEVRAWMDAHVPKEPLVTLEMYMHEDSQKSRDAFVDTGKAAKF